MLRIFAVSLLISGTLSFADEPDAFKLAAPAGWGGETIKLPPGFAPEMKLQGSEHIRFAPGMMKPESDSFFCYAFAFELQPQPVLTEAVVKEEFLKYYRGLCQAVLSGKRPDVDPSEFTLELQQVKSDAQSSPRDKATDTPTQYTGALEWVEPFATKKPQKLNLEIHTWSSRDRSYIFACVSPRARDAAIWKQLHSIRAGYLNKRPHIRIRGVYGGVPVELLERGTLQDYGVNAIFMGSGGITEERIALLKKQGAQVFAEFNTMHVASYLNEHPDAAPVGVDGEACPPPHGWQGVCPTHAGYRRFRMDAFREVLREFELDGIWLDYHHSHARWERDVPDMPDTCFCERCISQFRQETKTDLPDETTAQLARRLLDQHKDRWVQWRCDVFTDWVREFREIVDETRPQALLGTFHCPWTDQEFDGALRNKLAIDLRAQAKYIDVFSIMPYHARFGHAADPSWISQQTAWLGDYLGIQGEPTERHRIWPIVQLSDWGETVSVDQVRSVMDHGTRRPATGVMVFNWGSLRGQKEKVSEMGEYYRAIRP